MEDSMKNTRKIASAEPGPSVCPNSSAIRLSLSCASVIAAAALWLAFPLGAQTTEAGQEPPPAQLTLKSALMQALQSSRELALARLQATVADRNAGVARARFLPNLFTGSGAGYSSGFPQTPGGAAPSLFNLAYIQTLFNSPLRGEARAAQERTSIQRLETDRTRDEVMVRTASTFLELSKVRHALDLLRQERSSSTRILEVTRERVGAGFELPIEVTRAELTAARVEQRRLQLEGREDALEAQLRDLCGLRPDRHIDLAVTDFANFAGLADRPLGELVELGVQNSIVLQQAELEVRARQHRLHGERGGYFPTVDLVGEYSVLAKFNNYDQFYRKFQRNNVNIGVQVNIPIFSARTKAAVDLAREDLSTAELELRAKRSRVESDLRQQARRDRELEAGREVARLELKLTQEDLRVLQARFDEGRASLRELETMRLEESNRWLAFLDADFAQQQARIELLRSTGQLAALLQ